MPARPGDEGLLGPVEQLGALSPGVDYGLKNDDGFDPSRYDFYNPSYRTAGKAFVVRLEEYDLSEDWCLASLKDCIY